MAEGELVPDHDDDIRARIVGSSSGMARIRPCVPSHCHFALTCGPDHADLVWGAPDPRGTTMTELHVVATIPAKPGSEETVRALLTTLAAATREEEGCLAYDLFESGAAPGTFVTLERWRAQADLDAHLTTPHIAEAMTASADHLGGDIAIHPLSPVA